MFSSFPIGMQHMVMLKQMGGYFSLTGQSNKPLYREQSCFSPHHHAYLIDELMIKGVMTESDFFTDIEHLDEYTFSIEKCVNVREFLILTKMDFTGEDAIKQRLFGKLFENVDCLELTKYYLRLITLTQTFNDNFTFVGNGIDILCSTMHSDKGCQVNVPIPPCELTRIRLMMMAFIQNEIMDDTRIKDIPEHLIHKQISMRVFFHDQIIEQWRREIEFDIVSERFSSYGSRSAALEHHLYKKDKIFILFNDVSFNCEDRCCKFYIYIVNGDFLLPGLRRDLLKLSTNVTSMKYAIDVNNKIGLSSECQFRDVDVK